MPEDDEGSNIDIGLGRTLALSDGIFAIAMTLVAFQIQAPVLRSKDAHLLAHQLSQMGASYLVYLISFAVIGLLWLAHHRLFRHVARSDEPLMMVNLLFLMAVAALPFPCAVLGRYGNQPVAVVLYASAMAVAGLLLSALTVLAYRRGLVSSTAEPEGLTIGLWRSLSMVTVFVASIPLGFVAPTVAPYLWLALVPMRFVNPRRKRKSALAGVGPSD